MRLTRSRTRSDNRYYRRKLKNKRDRGRLKNYLKKKSVKKLKVVKNNNHNQYNNQRSQSQNQPLKEWVQRKQTS